MQINWWVSIWWGTLVINGLRFITVSAVHSGFLKVLKTYFEFCGKVEVVELSLNLFFFCQTWIISQNICYTKMNSFKDWLITIFFLFLKGTSEGKVFCSITCASYYISPYLYIAIITLTSVPIVLCSYPLSLVFSKI